VTIDLRRETEEFQKWVELKVAAFRQAMGEKQPPQSIGGIVAMYCYVQDGWIGLDFNTLEEFEFDGDMSATAWDDLLKRPAWQAFAESTGPVEMTFLEMDGTSTSVPADAKTDEFLSSHFGQMIADVLRTAWDQGAFSALPLRPGCVLMVDDFYGNWGWEAKDVSGKLVTV
jgi:hypothetical protein